MRGAGADLVPRQGCAVDKEQHRHREGAEQPQPLRRRALRGA